MITRITMDKTVDLVGKTYVKGEVYDSRFPHDAPVAISPRNIEFFVGLGWAHEQTWEEWFAQLGRNRKANIAACTDPERKAQLMAADAHCSAMDGVMGRGRSL
jgi:hypothetical protein